MIKEPKYTNLLDVNEKNRNLNKILESGLRSLDLTKKQHTKAVSEYKSISEHLASLKWFCEKYRPDIFPQGSMDLGTCVRPIGSDEFDLDIIVLMHCLLGAKLTELMDDLEFAMKSFDGRHSGIKRLKCCLRLDYPGDFHLDLVPARPDACDGNPEAMLISNHDGELGTKTDPKAFSEYFEDAKSKVLVSANFSEGWKLANSARATIAPAPLASTPENKTTLQLVIQILKRHRDLFFEGRDDAPSSSAISALATDCYQGHQDLYEAVEYAINHMKDFVRSVAPRVPNARYLVEDYADRWASDSTKEKAFWEWYVKVQEDFDKLGVFKIANASETLHPILGEKAVVSALNDFDAEGVTNLRNDNKLGATAGLGLLSSTLSGTKAAQPTSFFGN